MAWIPDVVPYATIESAWGNTIRDRTVHTYANNAARNAHAADGMVAWTVAEAQLAIYRADVASWMIIYQDWQTYVPVIRLSTVPATPPVTTVLARWKRTGDEVRGSVIVAMTGPSAAGAGYFSVTAPVANVAPEQTICGSGTVTNFATGLTVPCLPRIEYGSFFLMKLDGSIVAANSFGDRYACDLTFRYAAAVT